MLKKINAVLIINVVCAIKDVIWRNQASFIMSLAQCNLYVLSVHFCHTYISLKVSKGISHSIF